MLHLLQMGPFKMLTTLPLQIQNSWQLSLLELRPCYILADNSVTSSSGSSGMYTSIVQSGPPRLMLHSRPTLAFKLLILLLPIFFFSLCSLTTASCSWLTFHASGFLFPLTPLWLFNGILAVSEPGEMNCYIFFRPIPLTIFVFRNPILTHLPLSGSLDSLL